MEKVNKYIQKLEKTYNSEKDLTNRHLFFLVNTTKPEECKNITRILDYWKKVFTAEEDIIHLLCGQDIKFKKDGKTIHLKNVSKNYTPTWRAYLRNQFTDLGPANLEKLIIWHKIINKNLQKIIKTCISLNLVHEPTINI